MLRKFVFAIASLGAVLGLTFFAGSAQAAALPVESSAAAASPSVLDPDDHFWLRASIIEAAAETIGVRPEQVLDGLQHGRSLDEIARRHGVGEERLERGILRDESVDLARRVAEGKMSWDRADAIMDWLVRHIDAIVRHRGHFEAVFGE